MTKRYAMQMAERELTEAEAWEILEAGEYAVVSTVDPDGTPYGIPLSYVIIDGKLYIHTGERGGHKIDDFLHDARVSVAVALKWTPVSRTRSSRHASLRSSHRGASRRWRIRPWSAACSWTSA